MKYLYNVIYIVLACAAVKYVRQLSSTDLAGLGLDIFVYFGAVLVGVILFAKSIMKVNKENRNSYIGFAINAIGLLSIVLAVCFAGR